MQIEKVIQAILNRNLIYPRFSSIMSATSVLNSDSHSQTEKYLSTKVKLFYLVMWL